jgi:hypothetical protein
LADKRKRQRRDRALRLGALLCVLGAVAIIAAAAYGQLFPGPANDLFALGQGTGDSPPQVPIVQRAEPPFVATPVARCGPGSHPEPSVDGRVPAGSAAHGLNCNMTLVAHQGTEGGFKVLRYVDSHGHDCAFYDTTLLFPLNALNPGGGSAGVTVLDMSNPAHPVKTASLLTPAMISPHESLNLNARRGLLAAVDGNPSTYPGWVDVYDVHSDCRHPVLDANGPFARLGHESGFSADGKTFYATSTAYNSITAIDLTNPKSPHAVWEGNIFSHGMSLSDDGNRAYIADPHHNLLILDTSQIQARNPSPHAREISRLTWTAASIPQNAIPFTENGHPYLLEIDEYNQATLNPGGNPDMVGAARIIDISNETQPFVVANLRLQIDQPADHAAATQAGDPGTSNQAQGYAAHYCNIPTEVNPKVVACSFIASGLRVFDISNLTHPKEIGYYVAPPQPRSENGYMASDFAMSKPAFVPQRREIWWTDGTTGFYVLRVAASVWPSANGGSSGASGRTICAIGNRRILVKAAIARHAHVRSVRATLGGHRIRVIRRGHAYYAVVNPRSIHGAERLVIKVRLSNGRIVVSRRMYRRCGHRRH